MGACRRAGGAEHLLPAHDHLHRPLRLLGEQHRQRFQIDHRLAAEAAADFRGDELEVGHAHVQHAGRLAAQREVPLSAGPDRRLPGLVHRRRAGMRLDVALMHHGNAVLAFHGHVCLLEAFLDVTAGQRHNRSNIARIFSRFRKILRKTLLINERCIRVPLPHPDRAPASAPRSPPQWLPGRHQPGTRRSQRRPQRDDRDRGPCLWP